MNQTTTVVNAINAAKEAIARALASPADHLSIRDASLTGSRLLTTLAILDGRMDIDAVSITLTSAPDAPAKPTPAL